MAQLLIQTELNESQMTAIVDDVMKYVRKTEIEDLMFDSEVCEHRVYIEFLIGSSGITIKDADIQGSQYSLKRDSFVLQCRLEDEMLDYNKERYESMLQAQDIREYEHEQLLNHAI